MFGEFNPELSDVFSFGLILLQLLGNVNEYDIYEMNDL